MIWENYCNKFEYPKPDEQLNLVFSSPAGLSKNLVDPVHQMRISLTSGHIVIIILFVKAELHVQRNMIPAEHIT